MLKDNFANIIYNYNINKITSKYINYFNSLDDDLNNMPNMLFYGPPACGKYSEALKLVSKYSQSQLKYEKKIIINITKNEHIIKISDIHYEIDLENLTCNSKILFNNIYMHIIDAIKNSQNKEGIIVCKNFHLISNEILEIFYSYCQKNIFDNLTVKFIILTEHISFIPKNIIDKFKILYYSKLSNTNYIKLSNKYNKKILQSEYYDKIINDLNNINILKNVDLNNENIEFLNIKKKICDNIVSIIINKNQLNYIRNVLYDMLIYNLNIYECIEYIIEKVILNYTGNKCKSLVYNNILVETCNFFKFYNNNYRPIYHLESYILYLIKIYNDE
tara:strand:- start:514 stop:1509 length:996 start_codon:yes stop_codon:yes gene_type:complete